MSNLEAYYQTLMVIVLLRYLVLFNKTPIGTGIIIVMSAYVLSEQFTLVNTSVNWLLSVANFICVFWLTRTFLIKK